MAEALADAKRKFPPRPSSEFWEAGTSKEGNGVPHQLKDLGIAELETLIPVIDQGGVHARRHLLCRRRIHVATHGRNAAAGSPAGWASCWAGDGAPRISRVVGDSVAEAAGLKAGRSGGAGSRRWRCEIPDDLVDVVGRQAPGTWLPLSIKRDGQEIDLIAKFPPRPKQDG